jgi:argininosuccinate lyase
VRTAELQGVPLTELTLEDLCKLHSAFEEDVADVWDFEQSVERRDVAGGTSRRAVLAQVDQLRQWLGAR